MLLVIDAGNTNITFGVYSGKNLLNSWRISTSLHRTADEYAVWLTQLMSLSGLSPKSIATTLIASVVPAVNFALSQLVRKYFHAIPRFVGESNVALGIVVDVPFPREVGADRLVNVIAAYDLIRRAGIVIDFGTATTFDVMDKKGNYKGGVIAPGVNLSLKALYEAAAKLPQISVEPTPKAIGTNTRTAMQSGIYWGYVGMIEGLIVRMKKELGGNVGIVATGGLAPLFSKATTLIDINVESLTLDGLALIHQRNLNGKSKSKRKNSNKKT